MLMNAKGHKQVRQRCTLLQVCRALATTHFTNKAAVLEGMQHHWRTEGLQMHGRHRQMHGGGEEGLQTNGQQDRHMEVGRVSNTTRTVEMTVDRTGTGDLSVCPTTAVCRS